MKEFEQEIRQSESNFGHELMAKAEELFKKDAENEVAQYSFLNKDWKLLTKDLQQFGFKKFIDKAIGKTIFLIFPQKLKLVTIKKYGTFLMPLNFFFLKKKSQLMKKGKVSAYQLKNQEKLTALNLPWLRKQSPPKKIFSANINNYLLLLILIIVIFFLKKIFYG